MIVAVGAGFRLWRLGSSQLNYDEAFTAMAGRLPLGAMIQHLRLGDSHPPLDYLLRAPLARAGLSETLVRLPSAVCSIAALALFAWWMRERGRVGVFATVMMALAVFQIAQGREARMYAELEIVGVAVAIVVEAWLRAPRRWCAPLAGLLTAFALLTHASGLLLASGLMLVPGRRTDREAWLWRIAIAVGGSVWAVLWAPAFLTQAHGGHSQWIPRSTVSGAVSVVGSLVTPAAGAEILLVVAIVAGGKVLFARDRVLAHTWICCFAVPVALAIGYGRFSPVLLDRTLTLFSWGAPFAVAVALDALIPSATVASGLVLAVTVAVMAPAAVVTVNATSGPSTALVRLAAVARPGDIVAIEPISKQVELGWSLGVRSRSGPTHPVQLDIAGTPALELTAAPRSGRVWLLDFNGTRPWPAGASRCAPDWFRAPYRIACLNLGSRLPAPGRPGVLSAAPVPDPASPGVS